MIEADGEAGFYLMVTSVCPVGSVVGCHSAVLFLVKGNNKNNNNKNNISSQLQYFHLHLSDDLLS